MIYPEVTLYDLWFVTPQAPVFVMSSDADTPWEYTGGEEGQHLFVFDVQPKRYPNYGLVLYVRVFRKKED